MFSHLTFLKVLCNRNYSPCCKGKVTEAERSITAFPNPSPPGPGTQGPPAAGEHVEVFGPTARQEARAGGGNTMLPSPVWSPLESLLDGKTTWGWLLTIEHAHSVSPSSLKPPPNLLELATGAKFPNPQKRGSRNPLLTWGSRGKWSKYHDPPGVLVSVPA